MVSRNRNLLVGVGSGELLIHGDSFAENFESLKGLAKAARLRRRDAEKGVM